MWRASGNCSEHTGTLLLLEGFSTNDKVIDEATSKRIEVSIKKGCYLLIQMLERSANVYRSNIYVGTLVEEIIQPLNSLCQKYFSLIPVVGTALTSPLKTAFTNSERFTMYHDHSEHSKSMSIVVDGSACGCSILQLLILHSNKMTFKAQNDILNLIVLLSSCNQFQSAMNIDYYENFRLLFPRQPEMLDIEPTTSKLLNLNDQLVFIEEASYEAFKTAKIDLFFKAIKDLVTIHIIKGEFKGPRKLIGVQALQCLKGFLRCPAVLKEFFQSGYLTTLFIDIFFEIEKHRIYFNPEFSSDSLTPEEFQEREIHVQNNLTVEKQCMLVFKDIAGCLAELPNETKDQVYPIIFRCLSVKIKALDCGSDQQKLRYTDCTLERAFALFMVSYLFFDNEK